MIDLLPPQPLQVPNHYEVLKFTAFGADGNANFQPVAGAPTLDLARQAVKTLGLKHYSIRLSVFIETYAPQPDPAAPGLNLSAAN